MALPLKTECYEDGKLAWPRAGREILAQFDESTVVVYQAFNTEIADWAVAHQSFGGPS